MYIWLETSTAMKRLVIIMLAFIFSQHFCTAQFKKQLDNLSALYHSSTSDSDKVDALGKVANLYYTYRYATQADSVLHQQLLIADLSDNHNLLLLALFGDAITNISPYADRETFDRTVAFLQKGINYAKSKNQYEYIAIGYSRMANLLRKRGQHDNALTNVQIALSYLPNITSDSIKASIYIDLGNIYQAKSESVLASSSYNTAFDIAVKIKSIPLQSEIYHCFSEMYRILGNLDIAKEELKKSLALNKKNNYTVGMVRDYYDLARITDEKFYIEKTIDLAAPLHLNKYILDAKELMFFYYMVIEKNSDRTLQYLESEPDLKQSIINLGTANYNKQLGHIYFYSKKYDSALYYYKLTEIDYVNHFDEKLSKGIFSQIAITYENLGDVANAIKYHSQVLTLSEKMNDINSIASSTTALSALYERQGDFKLAYTFSKQAKQFQDSIRKLSEGRDIALLNVERENRKHAEELRQEEIRLINKRNIQYMAITIAIAVIFTFMLILGMFPISKVTIKMLGYFFFISLFEFIVLLIDTFLHRITHGEPLKIWLIKIFLIALLVPIQHFLEHRLIKFLESRKLLEARTRFSLKKWLMKTKRPAAAKQTDFEEDTAVL